MSDGIRDQRIGEFLETLGSDNPTPGGGAAAGVAGASGAALIAMVANLTIDKQGYEQAWDRMREILPVVTAGRDELLDLAERDAAAFDAVMAAFRMPKETDDEKAVRRDAIQLAFEGAAAVPLQVAERAAEMIDLGREAVERGNDNAASDGLSAAYLLYAAVECAAANVLINAASLKDE
ncbi:MAG: cyclodeaminase/cyclohydrolase family protein, partial [Actinomycetota bacterium]